MTFKELQLADGAGPYVPDASVWRPASAVPWSLAPTPVAFDPDELERRPPGLWRYHEALPFADPVAAARLGMGEGGTPLVDLGDGITGKAEFMSPTLSFKDRGAAVLVAAAVELGVDRLVCDSSGNAGTAIAAYAARAGIRAEVYVPESTSAGKLHQARAHGATVVTVPGDRAATSRAAEDSVARSGAFYASHVWNPLFVEGTKTYAYELWEQLGRSAPECVVVPVGNGTLLLGAVKGFRELRLAGLVDELPSFVAVQAASCAPVWRQVTGGEVTDGATVAEGIAIARPPRLAEVARVLHEVRARVELVDDDETTRAQEALARRGVYVEPTAAVSYAVARRMRAQLGATCTVPLCGAGLKAPGVTAGQGGGPSGRGRR